MTELTRRLSAAAPDLLPLIARLGFVGALGAFFWRSALTKLDGFGLSAGAYVQILPKMAEAAGYDPSQMPLWAHGVVAAGTVAEFVLPALLLLGLFSRLTALGMMGFIVVMSLTDILGHGAMASEVIPHRLIWIAVLAVPLMLGGGRWSLDRIWSRT